MIKDGSCITIEYNGYIKDGNLLFDTTSEKKAKEAGIFQKEKQYSALNIIVGKELIVKGVDDSFKTKKVGDEYSIELSPEQAFGMRIGKLIKLIPTKYFTKSDIHPMRGLQVHIDNVPGTIISVSPGRVIVDFNHPLAGKELIYEVKIVAEVNDNKLIVQTVADYFFGKGNAKIGVEKHNLTVKTQVKVPEQMQNMFKKALKETLKSKYSVTFVA